MAIGMRSLIHCMYDGHSVCLSALWRNVAMCEVREGAYAHDFGFLHTGVAFCTQGWILHTGVVVPRCVGTRVVVYIPKGSWPTGRL